MGSRPATSRHFSKLPIVSAQQFYLKPFSPLSNPSPLLPHSLFPPTSNPPSVLRIPPSCPALLCLRQPTLQRAFPSACSHDLKRDRTAFLPPLSLSHIHLVIHTHNLRICLSCLSHTETPSCQSSPSFWVTSQWFFGVLMATRTLWRHGRIALQTRQNCLTSWLQPETWTGKTSEQLGTWPGGCPVKQVEYVCQYLQNETK